MQLLTQKICIRCGNKYFPSGNYHKYCSDCAIIVGKEQKWKWHLRHHPKMGFKSKLCINCDQEYFPMNNIQKYCQTCSPIMRIEHARQKDKDDYAKIIKEGWKIKRCRKCNTEFKPHSSGQFYCSPCGEIVHKEQVKGVMARSKSKRRQLGFNLLNTYKENSVAHHINKEDVIYIPKEIHISISHNVWTGKNMDKINELAYQQLTP